MYNFFSTPLYQNSLISYSRSEGVFSNLPTTKFRINPFRGGIPLIFTDWFTAFDYYLHVHPSLRNSVVTIESLDEYRVATGSVWSFDSTKLPFLSDELHFE